MTKFRYWRGDCIERMQELDDDSIDAVVCDPPYGLEFMGKDWDRLSGQPGYNERGRMTPASSGLVANKGFDRIPNSYQAGQPMQEWHHRWALEAFRVLKPGGHLLAFGGTRTYHRLACAIEDAGFEIRDSIDWIYGSGFPKSQNVGKAIDKQNGAPRKIVGVKSGHEDFASRTDAHSAGGRSEGWERPWRDDPEAVAASHMETRGESGWDGWGTALKPAHEPIVMARKPFKGTVAKNVLTHGTGAINIDDTRIGFQNDDDQRSAFPGGRLTSHGKGHLAGPGSAQEVKRSGFETSRASGRWPANIILSHASGCRKIGKKKVKAITGTNSGRGAGTKAERSDVYGKYKGRKDMKAGAPVGKGDADGMETVERWDCVEGCPVAELDAHTGTLKSGDLMSHHADNGKNAERYGRMKGRKRTDRAGDQGGASRFFYVAKASRSERNAGVDGPEKPLLWSSGTKNPGSFQSDGTKKAATNNHPTVKPVMLMRYLVRLVTPPGGTVLDPFMGSGTTGVACVKEHFSFIGIEKDKGYLKIAKARIRHALEQQ